MLARIFGRRGGQEGYTEHREKTCDLLYRLPPQISHRIAPLALLHELVYVLDGVSPARSAICGAGEGRVAEAGRMDF